MAPTNPNRVAEPYEPFTKCDLGTEGCTDGCHTWGYVDGKTVAVCRCAPPEADVVSIMCRRGR